VVPQYLLELAATGTRWNRPLADTLARPLTEEGMSVELARISTDADAEVQATQNTALTGTTPAASSVTVPVRTVPIRTTTSRQFLERAEAGSDFLFAQELMAAHDAKVEQLLLNGSGASGEPTGLLNTSGVASVTFTSATPTLTEFVTRVAAAITTATANRGIAPDTLVVHPRRWAYNLARAEQTNTAAVSGVSRPGAPPTAVGSCLGLDVVMSAAVPTTLSSTQDVALVGRRSDWVYLETPPFTHLDADFTSSNSLQIAYRAYRYVAVDGSRYADGSVKVTGTGMAAVAS
jgi:HK97 family phage major capsid protein